jgi:hypothetical protein
MAPSPSPTTFEAIAKMSVPAVLPRGRNFGRRTQKGPYKKYVRPEQLAAEFSLIMPKKGRKGAELF